MYSFEKSIEKCCFTGYRPSKLPFKVDRRDSEYIAFENALIEKIITLIQNGCSVFYSGMAMGFDIIAAETVLLLRKKSSFPIKLICVVPFRNQKDTFGELWRKKYDFIIENCDETIVLYEDYFKGCYQRRNKYMVDNSDCVLTWFDGKSGGTKNTIEYADEKGRFILNLNETADKNYAQQITIDLI